jgi:phenylpropionate dioxygenase-like ring-hydroxylating dioxygenase large terminal subunit
MVLDEWHPIADSSEVRGRGPVRTRLLGAPVTYEVDPGGMQHAWRYNSAGQRVDLPTRDRFGYLWATLGAPGHDLFVIPECDEPDRRTMNASTIGVHVSAPRAVENFLDMAHFPFVHSGVLGAEPHTEIRDYDVSVDPVGGEIYATKCLIYQPKAAASSSAGADVEYTYRVPHPFCSVLYKTSGTDVGRQDVIALFVHPLDEVNVRAHLFLSVLDETNEDKEIRSFQQSIFGQDKPILENQLPKRLPLSPRVEIPIRADKVSVAYRRWLSDSGISYGVIRGER